MTRHFLIYLFPPALAILLASVALIVAAQHMPRDRPELQVKEEALLEKMKNETLPEQAYEALIGSMIADEQQSRRYIQVLKDSYEHLAAILAALAGWTMLGGYLYARKSNK
jgi:hypothetical protein